MLIEAYVDQVDTAVAAERSGAGRLELCGPGDGGLTPSAELFASVASAVRIPIHAMVRPRTGDFVYDENEFADMRRDVVRLRDAGAAGIVFGVSLPGGALDVARMRALVALARPARVGVHRAFDRAPDPDQALDEVVALGIDVVLTSGHAPTAEEGIAMLARLVRRAGGRTVVMPGGGVRAHNAPRIVRETGATAIHARAADAAVFAELCAAMRGG